MMVGREGEAMGGGGGEVSGGPWMSYFKTSGGNIIARISVGDGLVLIANWS